MLLLKSGGNEDAATCRDIGGRKEAATILEYLNPLSTTCTDNAGL